MEKSKKQKILRDIHKPPVHLLFCDFLKYAQNAYANIGSMKIAIPTPIKL